MLGEDVIQGADIEEVVNYIVPVLQRREGELTIQNQTDIPLSLTQPVLQSLIQVVGLIWKLNTGCTKSFIFLKWTLLY